MKVKQLDDSHRCLLEHLETFRKMMTSYDEIRDYVTDVLQELARDLNREQSSAKFDEKTIPRGWLDASDLPNWKRTNNALVAVGLEGFERGLGAIVGSSAVDQCWAYVYSPYYYSVNDAIAIDELRRKKGLWQQRGEDIYLRRVLMNCLLKISAIAKPSRNISVSR